MSADTPTGPYHVAVADARLPDTSPRSSRLRLFYPTPNPPTAATSAPWFPPSISFPDDTVQNLLRFAKIPAPWLLGLPFHRMAKYPLPAATATPLLSSPLRFQVLLFSHGLVGSTAGYSSTCIEAASHGFIVIAPEHTDGSAIISYVGSDRQRLRYTYYSADTHRMTEGQFRKNQIQVRIDDLSSLIEQLHLLHSGEAQLIPLATNAPPPDLTGRLSLDTLLLAGHSFGAATVLQFANHVSSTHILLLDPWLLPLQKEGVAACRVGDARVLVIHQELSKMTQSRSLLTNLPPCKPDALMLAVEIMGGRHNNSSDFPLRMPRWVAISSGMTSRGSDPLHLLQVQNRAVAAFLSDNHEWKEFVNRVKKGEEQGLALAST